MRCRILIAKDCAMMIYWYNLHIMSFIVLQVLSDSETVRWLNHAVENIWPICMENIVSQKILFPIIPWFLEKYKPWTAVWFVLFGYLSLIVLWSNNMNFNLFLNYLIWISYSLCNFDQERFSFSLFWSIICFIYVCVNIKFSLQLLVW